VTSGAQHKIDVDAAARECCSPPPVRWLHIVESLHCVSLRDVRWKASGYVRRSGKPGHWFFAVGVCAQSEELEFRTGVTASQAEARRRVEAGWHELHVAMFERLRAGARSNVG